MSKTFNDLAVTIKRMDWKENGRLFVFYTCEHGRIDAIARGAKKINSKMAGHLEPFGIAQIMIARGKTVNQVAGAAKIKGFDQIINDLSKIYIVNYIFEVIGALTKPDQADKKIYNLLIDFLELLDSASNDKNNELRLLLFANIFGFKFLDYLGFSVDLYECVRCKNKLRPGGNYFDPRKGGIVCSDCHSDNQELLPISREVIKVLRLTREKDLNFFAKLKVDGLAIKELDKIIFLYLQEFIEKEIKTREVLAKIFNQR